MVSGLITDSQITASSHTDRSWVPENARLLTSRTGWTLLPQPQPFTNEWLQVDLGEEKLVKGLIIQGGKHRENKVFMKKFRLGYSNNGSDWRMVLDTNGNKPKVRVLFFFSFLEHVLQRSHTMLKDVQIHRDICSILQQNQRHNLNQRILNKFFQGNGLELMV